MPVKRQKGGFLEPLQTIPEFHYTQSEERKNWVKIMYPYAPYFFSMFQEIPWKEWKYEDDELVAESALVPYVIIGGSACELFNKVYGSHLPKQAELHTNTDPTGDIDVKIPGMRIKPKNVKRGKRIKRSYTYLKSDNITLEPYTSSYVIWLLDNIEAYFKKLSYNFAEWFPSSANFSYEDNNEARYANTSTVRSVGPFHIYLTLVPDEGKNTLAIQVSMAHKISPESDEIYQEHFMEFLLSWESPVTFDDIHPHIYLEDLQLILTDPAAELQRNTQAIRSRIQFIDTPEVVHKVKNHFGRAIFLINLLNLPRFYDTMTEGRRLIVAGLYKNGIDIAASIPQTHEDAIKMITHCPMNFKSGVSIQNEYKKLCETVLHISLEQCGLTKNSSGIAGGRRKTRKNTKRGHIRKSRSLLHSIKGIL